MSNGLRFLFACPSELCYTYSNLYRAESEDGIVQMKLLQDRIVADGKIEAGNILKGDSFLNHQIDVSLLEEIGQEFRQFWYERWGKKSIFISY